MSRHEDTANSSRQERIVAILEELKPRAPAGFAIGLHVRFTSVRFMFQTYPKSWVDDYTANGYAMRDPTVLWGLEHTGRIDWRNLDPGDEDEALVMRLAAEAGLAHGLTVALDRSGSRTIASFAHDRRPFTEEEAAEIETHLERLHDDTLETRSLSTRTSAMLRRMSIAFTHP